MKRKPTSVADPVTVRVVLVTMDPHLSSATVRAAEQLQRQVPGLKLVLHAAAEWASAPETLARCCDDIAEADIIVATMLFMEDHFKPV
ncbi:DUF3479 domain-containing protein, partial [bacterium]